MLQSKTYILLTFPTIKTKIKNMSNEWTDNETFRFRNALFWTAVGKKLLFMGKNKPRKRIIVCAK